MAIFVDSPSCATAVPDLHSPVIVVGRNCEYIRDRGRDNHSAKHSNQKYAFHFYIPTIPLFYFLLLRSVRWILPCHSRAIPCSLFWINAFPHTSLIRHRSSRASRFLRGTLLISSFDGRASLVGFPIIRKQFCLVLTTNEHPPSSRSRGTTAWQANKHECRAPAPDANGGRESQPELIVIFVRADPEPIVMSFPLAGERPIAATDFGGVNASLLAEA